MRKTISNYLKNNDISLINRNDIEKTLILASENGHLDIVKYLLGNDTNPHANMALTSAAINGHLDVVKYLVEYGLDINSQNDYVLTLSKALAFASVHGHFTIVKYLFEKGANIHIKDNYALRWASKNGHIDIVKYLLDNGAYIHALHDCSLMWASSEGHLNVVKYLLENGVNPHVDDNRALTSAAENSHLAVVKCLIEYGVDINNAVISTQIKYLFRDIKCILLKKVLILILKIIMLWDWSQKMDILISLNICFIMERIFMLCMIVL